MSNSSLKAMTGCQIKARRLAGRTALILMAALMTVAALGCYNIRTGRVDVGGSINFKLPAFTQTGPHAVDIFTEMHFQPSYRTQEGPRILPPPDSVPITGKEVEYKSVEEYQAMDIPSEIASESETLSRARQDLSRRTVWCAMAPNLAG